MNQRTMTPDLNYPIVSLPMPPACNTVRLTNGHSMLTESYCANRLPQIYCSILNVTDSVVGYLGDNTPSKKYTNAQGGRIQSISLIYDHFKVYYRTNRIVMQQAYRSGKQLMKWGVDGWSRMKGLTEVTLRQWIYSHLQLDCQLGLFATQENALCPHYLARFPDLHQRQADALTCPWEHLPASVWAHPPLNIVLPFLQRVQAIQPLHVTIHALIPIWTTALWWPLLLQLMAGWPTIVPLDRHHFWSPIEAKQLSSKQWTMCSCVLSNRRTEQLAFHTELQSAVATGSLVEHLQRTALPYETSSATASSITALGEMLTRLSWQTT